MLIAIPAPRVEADADVKRRSNLQAWKFVRVMRSLGKDRLDRRGGVADFKPTLTATRSHISRRLVHGRSATSTDIFVADPARDSPEHQPLFLPVVDVLLKIQHVVRGEQVASVRALDDAARGRRRARLRIMAVHHQRRCRRCRRGLRNQAA